MVKIWVLVHPHAGRCLDVRQVWADALCVVLFGPKSHRKKKTESKLKDAMSQSSDEREERDVGAGKHDSAVGLKEKKKEKEKPSEKGYANDGKKSKRRDFLQRCYIPAFPSPRALRVGIQK